MLVLFVSLSALSVICAVVGFGLVIAKRGQVKRQMSRRRLVRSDGVSVEGEITFAEMKAALSQGRIGDALGGLLAVGGMLGLMLFGALALFVALDNKVVGGMVVAICAFGVVRMVLRIIKA